MYFLEWKCKILTKMSWKFVFKVAINNIPSLVQIMAWCWPVDKPLSELMMVRLLMHICVTGPQILKSCQIHGVFNFMQNKVQFELLITGKSGRYLWPLTKLICQGKKHNTFRLIFLNSSLKFNYQHSVNLVSLQQASLANWESFDNHFIVEWHLNSLTCWETKNNMWLNVHVLVCKVQLCLMLYHWQMN